MYSGYKLTDKSKRRLEILYPPTYSTFIGDHITKIFGVSKDHPLPEQPNDVKVIGYYCKDGLEFFTVAVDNAVDRPKGGQYHLTWSIDKSMNVKPVHSNDHVDEATNVYPITISVIPFIE